MGSLGFLMCGVCAGSASLAANRTFFRTLARIVRMIEYEVGWKNIKLLVLKRFSLDIPTSSTMKYVCGDGETALPSCQDAKESKGEFKGRQTYGSEQGNKMASVGLKQAAAAVAHPQEPCV